MEILNSLEQTELDDRRKANEVRDISGRRRDKRLASAKHLPAQVLIEVARKRDRFVRAAAERAIEVVQIGTYSNPRHAAHRDSVQLVQGRFRISRAVAAAQRSVGPHVLHDLGIV